MKVNISKYPKDRSKQRKVNIKIDRYDLWDFKSSVGLIILEWLKEFRKYNKHGVPGDLNHFTQSHESYFQQGAFDFYIKDNPPFENAEKEWHEILDKMIWSFDEIINGSHNDCYWKVKPEADWDHLDGEMDQVKYREYYEKIQEGVDLFAKHYVDLWD